MVGNMKKKTCYITTPIYYASGKVHIGNSYTTILCDVLARYYRLAGYDVRYLTGMDEHGLKIQEAAKQAGKDPKAFVDEIAKKTQRTWEMLGISYDDFIQTSSPQHVAVVQKAFNRLLEQGDIYLGEYEGNYCISCEAYFTALQLDSDGNCPDCHRPVRQMKEATYFLNLKKYSDRLLAYYQEHPEFVSPETRLNEVVSFVKMGLNDLSVSRTSFNWGVPVLGNPEHVVYVWIDALLNYVSALGYLTADDTAYRKYWTEGDVIIHVLGKDILRFHAVYWPIIQFALGIPPKAQELVHGWVLFDHNKMGKSRGNVVYPEPVVEHFGLDALRYYLACEMTLGNDGNFTYELFMERYNLDLANAYGNLVSRTLSMINKYRGGAVRLLPGKLAPSLALAEVAAQATEKYHHEMRAGKTAEALRAVFELIDRANKYVDETAPWNLAKDPAQADALDEVLYHLYEAIRVATILLSPVLINSAEKLWPALGLAGPQSFADTAFGTTESAQVAEKLAPLFQRLKIAEELEALNK